MSGAAPRMGETQSSGDREVRISRPSWNSVHSEKPSAQVYYMYRVALSARRTTAVPVETLA